MKLVFEALQSFDDDDVLTHFFSWPLFAPKSKHCVSLARPKWKKNGGNWCFNYFTPAIKAQTEQCSRALLALWECVNASPLPQGLLPSLSYRVLLS